METEGRAEARPKIAIVGGGPAGLSAAYHLAIQDRFDITVYQLGWRLGGKCATGRDVFATERNKGRPTNRIEEHGIHGFTNFYANAFKVVRGCYVARYPRDWEEKIRQNFIPSSFSRVYDHHGSQWVYRDTFLPTGIDGVPWDDQPFPFSEDQVWEGLSRMISARGSQGRSFVAKRTSDLTAGTGKHLTKPRAGILTLIVRPMVIWHLRKIRKALEIQDPRRRQKRLKRLRRLAWWAEKALELLHNTGPTWARLPFPLRRFQMVAHDAFHQLDFWTAVLNGVSRKGGSESLLESDVDAIDKYNYRTWLGRNGCTESTLRTAMVHSIPNILFAYEDGNTTRRPDLSAATYLGWMIRSLTGKGPYYWFFKEGTGESLITPIYEGLRSLGVEFEFFHRLSDIESNVPAGQNRKPGEAVRLVFQRQAIPTPDWDPLFELDVNGSKKRVWPNRPDFEHLRPAGSKARWSPEEDNLEAWDYPHTDPCHVQSTHLQGMKDERAHGCNHDGVFDHVVLAVPPKVLLKLDGLEGFDNWKPGRSWRTTATIAAQLWLDRDPMHLGLDVSMAGSPERQAEERAKMLKEAGRPPDPRLRRHHINWHNTVRPSVTQSLRPSVRRALRHEPSEERLATASAANPLPGIVAFNDLIEEEDWPEPAPKSLLYLCGPIENADSGDPRQRAEDRVTQYLRTMAAMFPDMGFPDIRDQTSIDFALLHNHTIPPSRDPSESVVRDQYTRINREPQDHYSLAWPTSAEERMRTWQSELTNVVPAGDWVYTGINCGSVESAMIGGALASMVLTGSPTVEEIEGFAFLHPGSATIADAVAAQSKAPLRPPDPQPS